MPLELNEDRILEALDRLSPQGRKKALSKLIGSLEALDRLVERNQKRLEAICRERGIDFSKLSETEREDLIDQILHEP